MSDTNNTIFGLEPKDELPEGSTPVDAIAIVKYLDKDGDMSLQLTSTRSLSSWEALGMATAAAASYKNDLVENFEESEGE
jgi:hypothetical protein